MTFGAAKILIPILFFNLIACTPAHAWCPVDVVVVKGRVDHAPRNARVHVQLVLGGGLVKGMRWSVGGATVLVFKLPYHDGANIFVGYEDQTSND